MRFGLRKQEPARGSVQDALRAALRDQVGPSARAHGFGGSAPTWRRTSDLGDWAVVNVQSSRYSTRDSLRCVVNLSLAPEPWLELRGEELGRRRAKPAESDGLYRERLHPTGTPTGHDGWWEVDHPDRAPEVVADVVRRLEADGWPVLSRLLDRDAFLAQVRSGSLGMLERRHHPEIFATAERLLADG